MKRFRLPAAWFAVCAVVASLWNGSVPAQASQQTFASQLAYYQRTGNDFLNRLDSLGQFESSSGSLDTWARDAAAKVSAYDTNAKNMATQINLETHSQPFAHWTDCDRARGDFLGWSPSNFGYGTLRLDYSLRLSTLKDVVDRLNADENKLLAKLADAQLNGKKFDVPTSNLLASTRAAANNLASLYHLMQAEYDYIDQIVLGLKREISELKGPGCGGPEPTATPSPSPTHSATPAPKTTPSAKPATPKPAPTPTPPSTPCKTGWQWWPGFGWRCVG
jgi:hypothetical protein